VIKAAGFALSLSLYRRNLSKNTELPWTVFSGEWSVRRAAASLSQAIPFYRKNAVIGKNRKTYARLFYAP
jgi:hypothetical protein